MFLSLLMKVLFGVHTNAFARPIILQEDDYSTTYFKWLMNEEIQAQFFPFTKGVKYELGEFTFSSGKARRNADPREESTHFFPRVLEIRSSIKSFKIYLKKESDLISSSMKVEYRGEKLNAKEMSNCLFKGTVWSDLQNETGSAAISTCDNGILNGIISTKSNRYLIQPLPLKVRGRRQVTSDKIVIFDISDSNSKHFCAVKCMPISNLEDKWAKAKSQFIPKQRTVEMAVFVDQQMVEWASRNSDGSPTQSVINIVLSIMNGVQTVFNDPSLEIEFKFVLVSLEIIEDNQDAPNAADGQINEYLNNFCNWQNEKKLSAAKKGLNTWDHGLLLSGMDLFTDKDEKRSAGLAWVSGMCRQTLSCSISEGTSFNAINIISHEIGHNLGMEHDGHTNSCPSDEYLMSSELGPERATWSQCSNHYSYVYLEQQYANCLDNEPGSNSQLNFSNVALPGQLFPADKQCQNAFGASFHPYITDQTPFENICRELWCANDTHVQGTHAALLGTTCDFLKVCKKGECVEDTGPQSITTGTTSSNETTTLTMNASSTTSSTNGPLTTHQIRQTTRSTTFRNTQQSTSPPNRQTTASDGSTPSSSNQLSVIPSTSTTFAGILTDGTSISTQSPTSLTSTTNQTTETTITRETIPTIPFSDSDSSETVSFFTLSTERFGDVTSTINVPRRTTASPTMTPYRIPPDETSIMSTISTNPTQITNANSTMLYLTTLTLPNSTPPRISITTYEYTRTSTKPLTTVPLFDIIIDNMNNKNSNRTKNDEDSFDIRILNNQTASN